jgi:short subunit dehydrogenase-like uncharacterized protein
MSGPYRFLGEPVVAACISAGSHYMDITGEPQFMEDMFLKYVTRSYISNNLCDLCAAVQCGRYHEAATEANVLVLHACAFDSVPADLGVVFCMQNSERTMA